MVRHPQRRTRWGVVLLLSLAVLGSWGLAPVQAQPCPDSAKGYEPYAYETLTVSSAVKSLTVSNIPAASDNRGMAYISVETDTVSVSDVVTPTSTVGHQMVAGTRFYV